MKSPVWILGFSILLIIWISYYINNQRPAVNRSISQTQKNMPLTIASSAFEMNGMIPPRFTCDGENISPELIFLNIPTETQSLALTMEDPDVPHSIRPDGMWNHWVVWNIPPNTTGVKEGELPQGVFGIGTSGESSYMGPCPPDREHRYIFTLYALDSILKLPSDSTKEELLQTLTPHLIEKATLVGHYNRTIRL
ncbi:MAG: YbhB/YbcL family Raf kinase inhibitor-like protein [Minisyncoccia bacterium]